MSNSNNHFIEYEVYYIKYDIIYVHMVIIFDLGTI